MKKNINETEQIVARMLNGFVHTHPQMDVVSKYKIIKKKFTNKNKVSLISGGGCGHEPAHAGFIGKGMIDAAVYGDIFMPPSLVQVYQGIKETAGNKGSLLIINNSNDNMSSFRNAAYLATEDGIEVDYVMVDDDIAMPDCSCAKGHHGVAGTIFVHKIAGASAEKGKSLSEVKRVAEKTIKNVKSIGSAKASCILPSKNGPEFEPGGGKLEFYTDIRDEPSVNGEQYTYAQDLAEQMISSISAELKLSAGQRVALLINGFGASPLMELYLLCNDALRILSNKGCIVARTFVGNLMTSINMSGASISILKLDSELETLLNAPCESPAFKVCGPADIIPYRDKFASTNRANSIIYTVETPTRHAVVGDKLTLDNIIFIMDVISESIIHNEATFNEMGAREGDGNFGTNLAKGFKQLKAEWKSILTQSHLSISSFLDACSLIIMEHCGGVSGLLCGSALRAAGRSVIGKKSLVIYDFTLMLKTAIKGIYDTGKHLLPDGTKINDKFLTDALIPCTNAWLLNAKKGTNFFQAFSDGANAVVDGIKNAEKIAENADYSESATEPSKEHPNTSTHALEVIFTDIANAIK